MNDRAQLGRSIGVLLIAGLLLLGLTWQRRSAPAAPTEGSGFVIRCAATRDVWLSAVEEERDFNMGAARRLKLKIWQEFALVDFDVSRLRGKRIDRAFLYLKPDGGHRLGLNGGSDLRWLSVSTVSHDWVEGRSRRYARDKTGHGATFRQSSYSRRNWGWEGSRIWDVILGNGNTLRFDGSLEPTSPEGKGPGWLRMEIDPDLVRALVAGASHGLALMDGSSHVSVNSFVKSRESGEGPFLEVVGSNEDAEPPGPPTEFSVAPAPSWATPEFGALKVRLKVPKDVFSLDLRIDGRAVRRWQIPFAADVDQLVSFPIQDLPPSRAVRVEVAAVDAAGNRSSFVSALGESSDRLTIPERSKAELQLPAGEPPSLGSAKVWVFPEVTKVDPVTGHVLGEAGAPDLRRGNSIWSGATRTIRLAAARGEIVSFQVAVEGRAESCGIEVSELSGLSGAGTVDGTKARLWRNWYVGRQAEYALPLVGTFEVPSADNHVEGQTIQAVTVDLHIPTDTPAGEYQGTVTVSSEDGSVPLTLLIKLYDVELPEDIHFNVELNTYRGPGKAGSERFKDSFRLAHYHRATINRVPYSQRGRVHSDWIPRVDARGRVVDWSHFDENLGGLLDGSWFEENPRKSVPVPVLYLPFFEGWPLDFRDHYDPGPGIPLDATDPDAKLRHDTLAKPIGEAINKRFKEVFVSVVQDFVDHFQKKGWNRTQLQFYLNGKPRFGYTLWTLDEPVEYLDWAALNFFGRLFKKAVADPEVYSPKWQQDLYRKGLSAMGRERPTFLFRADVSRPMWQGSVSDGVINTHYVGSRNLVHTRLLRQLRLRSPTLLSSYGSANPVDQSNWNSVAWCLRAFVSYADGVLPWQSIGGREAMNRPTRTALVIDGGSYGHAIASLRLHALRRGAQDSELLRLLELEKGWSRERLGLLLSKRVGLVAEEFDFDAVSGQQFLELKEEVLRLLTESST